jgi:hypothetical protein
LRKPAIRIADSDPGSCSQRCRAFITSPCSIASRTSFTSESGMIFLGLTVMEKSMASQAAATEHPSNAVHRMTPSQPEPAMMVHSPIPPSLAVSSIAAPSAATISCASPIAGNSATATRINIHTTNRDFLDMFILLSLVF